MRFVKKCGGAIVFVLLAGFCLGVVSLGAAEKETAGVTNGLIGHWPMNEGQGYVLKDVAGQVGNGEQVGAEWVPLGKGFCLKLGVPFKAGIDRDWPDNYSYGIRPRMFRNRAAAFDGRAYARIPINNLCRLAKQEKLKNKTVSLWAKPINGGVVDPAQGRGAFLLFGGTFLISYNKCKWHARVMSCYKDDMTGISGPAVESDKWTHLVLMNDEAFARFYINGDEVGLEQGPCLITNLVFPNSQKHGGGQIWLSYVGEGKSPVAFCGYIDDLKMFNKTLSAAEVKAEYQVGRAIHQ